MASARYACRVRRAAPIALVGLVLLGAGGGLAGCWRGAVVLPARRVAIEPVRARVHAFELAGAAALPDGGVVVASTRDTECAVPGRTLAVARFDPVGRRSWSRCLPESHLPALVAASPHAIWVVRHVDAEAPAHVHGDVHDLVVVDRFALDGATVDTRVAVTWRDAPGDDPAKLAYLRANVPVIAAAAGADDALVLAGSASRGRLVDGRWEVGSPAPDGGAGYVLELPDAGPMRVVLDEPAIAIDALAVAGGAYAIAGRCWSSAGMPTSIAVTCPHHAAAFVVDGELAAARPSHAHVIETEYQNLHVAIDTARDVIAVAASDDVARLGAKVVPSACGSPYAFAAAWSPDGALRFARAFGNCRHPGGERSIPVIDVFDVAYDGDRAVIALFVRPDPDSTAPIQFDRTQMSVRYADSGLIVELETTGHIARYRKLQFVGRPARPDQPDGSLAPDAGVHAVAIAASAGRVWIAVAHAGSLDDAGRLLLLGAAPARDLREPCDPRTLIGPPLDDVDPDDQGVCRHAVVLERAIELLAW